MNKFQNEFKHEKPEKYINNKNYFYKHKNLKNKLQSNFNENPDILKQNFFEINAEEIDQNNLLGNIMKARAKFVDRGERAEGLVARQRQNVHSIQNKERVKYVLAGLTDIFHRSQPNGLQGADYDLLHDEASDAFEGLFDRHPDLNKPKFGNVLVIDLARQGLAYMCEQARNGGTIIDLPQFKTGEVFAGAWAMVDRAKAGDQRDAIVGAIASALANAEGDNEDGHAWCNLRHAAELATSIKTVDFNKELPALIPDFEESRDAMANISKAIGSRVSFSGTAKDQQAIFMKEFRSAVSEHDAIPEYQIQKYLSDFVTRDWEEFKENIQK